jgi:hypothetical protein
MKNTSEGLLEVSGDAGQCDTDVAQWERRACKLLLNSSTSRDLSIFQLNITIKTSGTNAEWEDRLCGEAFK